MAKLVAKELSALHHSLNAPSKHVSVSRNYTVKMSSEYSIDVPKPSFYGDF